MKMKGKKGKGGKAGQTMPAHDESGMAAAMGGKGGKKKGKK